MIFGWDAIVFELSPFQQRTPHWILEGYTECAALLFWNKIMWFQLAECIFVAYALCD